MRSREWYESSIHNILCKCLPKIEPSNIRPAYNKSKLTNAFATNYVSGTNEMKNGIESVTNTRTFIYYWLHFDSLDSLTTEVSDDISAVLPMRLTVSIYGKDSFPLAARLRAFMRTEGVLFKMFNMQAVLDSDPSIDTFPEEIQGQWWERNDVTIRINVLVDDFVGGKEAAQFSLGEGKGYSTATGGEIEVEEVN